MLKNILSQKILSKPDIIQLYKDRKYEKAWIISNSEDRPTEEECLSYLNNEKFDVLRVEYIWNSRDDNNRF